MAKEINLFEQDLETETIAIREVAKPVDLAPTEAQSEASPKADEAAPPVSLAGEKLAQLLDKFQEKAEKKEQQDQGRRQVKGVIEALLFSSNDPITLNRIRDVVDQFHPLKPKVLKEIIDELRREYDAQGRAFMLSELESGYVLTTRDEYGKFVDLLYRNKRAEKLSQAATEVLAIIAYKQPVTRPQIDAIRGVDSSGTVHSLIERGLIEAVGKAEAPGRPSLYAVTSNFMKYFGLRCLGELPQIEQAKS